MSERIVRPRQGRAWNEHAIRRELTLFVAGRASWPTYQEFIGGGAKGLREAITRFGGDTYWAQEMGLAETRRQRGGVVRWTDEAIETALSELLDGRHSWPSRTEFEKAGLRGLGEILRERGDAARWADRMGVAPPAQLRTPAKRSKAKPRADTAASNQWRRWTEETIASALTEFLGERDEWPKHSEFIEAGHTGLYHAVLRHGGSRLWARRIGVRWVSRSRRHNPWTEQEVRSQLSAFLKDSDAWPSERQFVVAGRRDLLQAARRLGGTEKWRREFSLPRRA